MMLTPMQQADLCIPVAACTGAPNLPPDAADCQDGVITPARVSAPSKGHPTPEDKPLVAGHVDAPDRDRPVLRGTRFVLTVAQNNTYAHKAFLHALELYCDDRGARLLIARCTYNKSGFQKSEKDDKKIWYDPALQQYLMPAMSYMLAGPDESKTYEPIIFCAELNILPTAVRPLSGLENYTRDISCVVPHVKVAMTSVPTVIGGYGTPKMIYTTGAITQRNYIEKKAGQKAAFHHVYGALVVEFSKDTGCWFARQLIASNDGSFYDLTRHYGTVVSRGHHVLSVVLGDLHLPHRTAVREYSDATSGYSIIAKLKPEQVFVHDAIDFFAQNYHSWGSGRHNVEVSRTVQSVSNEMKLAGAELTRLHKYVKEHHGALHIVWSNHMDALIKWVEEAHWDECSEEDALLLLKLQKVLVSGIHNGTPLERDAVDSKIFFAATGNTPLLRHDPAMIHGVIHGMHGHLGPSGSRGNPNNLNNCGHKITCGHGHVAKIVDGVYQVGVLCPMRVGYNVGPQAWSYTHCIMYPNGKRCMITQKKYQWCVK